MRFSRKSNRLIGQGMFQVKAEAEEIERKLGKKLIHFEIGDVQFNPPKKIKKALIRAIKNNKTHYTDPKGLYELREKIALDFGCSVENVLISPANFSIFIALSLLCNEGDTISIPIPGFPTYFAVAKYLGLKIRKNAKKVRIINYPNNPTGEIKSAGLYKGWTIFDTTYEDLIYDSVKYFYKFNPNKTIFIHSFSKSHAIPALRLGYIIGPKDFIDKAGLFIETTMSCFPEFIQIAGLSIDSSYKFYELKKRRDIMYYELVKKGFKVKRPTGGIYFWVHVGDGDSFYKEALKKGVVVCPGSVFGKKEYIRICFAVDIKDIKQGVRLL